MRNNNPYKNYEQKSEVISLPQTPSFQHHYHLNMNIICPTFGGNYKKSYWFDFASRYYQLTR